jgi:glycosyltransferase involved in cell wall biosynthesis
MRRHIDILHIISGDLWAGAEAQAFYTLSDLQKQKKADIVVILFNDGILRKRLHEKGIETIVIDENKHNALIMAVILARLIRKMRPAIIHVHAYKEHILGQIANMLNFNRSTMVRTFHGLSDVPKGLPVVKHIQSSIMYKIEKWFLNSGSNLNIIAVSKDLQNFLKRSFPKATITQIYNGIPPIDKKIINRKEIRDEYGVSEKTFWIGTFARLAKPKNLGLLIDTGKELKLQGNDFRISIFGEGPLKQKLQNQIDHNNLQDHIKLEGFKTNIHPILASIDLFVLCSLHEGLPMSLLEAISLEVPVVCTDVGGIKEVITQSHSGLLVPSNDHQSLTEAIKKLMQNEALRDELAGNAKKMVEQVFNVDNTNKKLIDLYHAIIRSH